ncbi:hypothetical protein [Adhaeribacter aquaticus]|nr:hypothetical protein [Adhaeribacter aquaticus]
MFIKRSKKGVAPMLGGIYTCSSVLAADIVVKVVFAKFVAGIIITYLD